MRSLTSEGVAQWAGLLHRALQGWPQHAGQSEPSQPHGGSPVRHTTAHSAIAQTGEVKEHRHPLQSSHHRRPWPPLSATLLPTSPSPSRGHLSPSPHARKPRLGGGLTGHYEAWGWSHRAGAWPTQPPGAPQGHGQPLLLLFYSQAPSWEVKGRRGHGLAPRAAGCGQQDGAHTHTPRSATVPIRHLPCRRVAQEHGRDDRR